MKRFSILLVFLFWGCFEVFIQAQVHWDTQTAPGFSVTPNPFSVFSAVDQNICWGIGCYDVGFGVINPKMVLTTDGGETWSVTSVQLTFNFGVEAIYAINAQTAWIAVYDLNNGSNSGIFKTTNSGINWTRQGTAFMNGGHPTMIYFYDQSDTGICIGTPRNSRFEVYTTIDGGADWNYVQGANMPIVDSGDPFPTGYTGVGNIYLFGTYLRKVYRSTDRGNTFSKQNYSAAPGGVGLAVQLADSLKGIAGTYFGDLVNKMAETTHGGSNWTQIQPNYPPAMPSLYYLSYVPGTSGWYVVTSNSNVGLSEVTTPGSAYTLDNGETWNLIDTKPHGPSSFSPDGWGWSGGIGDTIYRIYRDVFPVGLLSFNSELPEHFSLEQNYPNPFNPSTKIQYSVPQTSQVQIKVFDELGEEIETLVSEEKPAGNYELNWNAKNLPSGVYFYQLRAGDFVETKKMLLLK